MSVEVGEFFGWCATTHLDSGPWGGPLVFLLNDGMCFVGKANKKHKDKPPMDNLGCVSFLGVPRGRSIYMVSLLQLLNQPKKGGSLWRFLPVSNPIMNPKLSLVFQS